ncbi:hypothetical protein D6D01_09336 [Aureobasidium pullulans]|uniref:Uncharacterized protein n=1 Tax=Aureobasidium pullulans TaxID=5580 RepID=A0A4S9K528_AURPU|nr:hypothetical protein D6D01_09336 [Aureobasidium pullulans]
MYDSLLAITAQEGCGFAVYDVQALPHCFRDRKSRRAAHYYERHLSHNSPPVMRWDSLPHGAVYSNLLEHCDTPDGPLFLHRSEYAIHYDIAIPS